MADEKPAKCDAGGGEKEGNNLLGEPTFQKLQNGRFKCVETGHELPDHAKDSYAHSKRCRIGLINYALSMKKTPLNMFKQDPVTSSKLICKLTGDTINKSEEHIWKHINGKRFLNKLEQVEAGNLAEDGIAEGKSGKQEKEGSKAKEKGVEKKKKEKKKEKEKDKKKEEIISEVRDLPADSDLEEPEFWMPPVGERWDFDDGGERWGSDSESGDENGDDDGADVENEEENNDSADLSKRTKRMSIEIGPSSFASRKKKRKTKSP